MGTPTDALLLADVASVTTTGLLQRAAEVAEHYWQRSQADGVAFEPVRSDPALAEPDGYGKGGDAALFSGYALAAFSLQAAHTRDDVALHRALASLRGVYYLTHVAGRGVIARCAFPSANALSWNYPRRWRSRLSVDRAFVGHTPEPIPGPPLLHPLDTPFPPSTYYTRGTKDQLTGLLFGLSVAWHVLGDHPAARATIAEIVHDLYEHLVAFDWYIRDANGKNATNADFVTGLLRTQLLALYRHTSGDPKIQELYEDEYTTGGYRNTLNVFNNATEYFAHNLRAARFFSTWLLSTDEERKTELAEGFLDNVWEHVEDHQSPWFSSLAAAMTPGRKGALGAQNALASLSFRPFRLWPSPYAGQAYEPPGYLCALFGGTQAFVLPPHLRKPVDNFLDSKPPWRVGRRVKTPPLGDTLGLDFLLPYWLARYFGVF
jgi:hypothetical protein